VRAAFVPEAGDFVWLTFDFKPAVSRQAASGAGAEPRMYNAKSGLAITCPITNQAKGTRSKWPFRLGVARPA